MCVGSSGIQIAFVSGVRTPSTCRFAAAQSERLLRSLNVQAARAATSSGIDAVHDLRVAIRHFRRILAVLKSCFPGPETRHLRKELKAITVRAGGVRDRDIAIALIRKLVGAEYPEMLAEFRGRRTEAAQVLRASLRDWNTNGSWNAWRRALRSAPVSASPPANDIAATLLPHMVKEHFQRGRKAVEDGAAVDMLHQFRITAKNLRYTIDSFEDFYGDSIGDIVSHLKEVQELIGDIHDCAVTRDLVKHAQTSEGKKEILRALKKRQRRKTESFQRDFGCEFSNAAVLRQWKKCLAHAAS